MDYKIFVRQFQFELTFGSGNQYLLATLIQTWERMWTIESLLQAIL